MLTQSLETLVINGQRIEITEGNGFFHYILNLEGRKVFYKTLKAVPLNKKPILKTLRVLDSLIVSVLASSNPGIGSLVDLSKSGIEKEARTLKAWKNAGISTPEIIGYSQNFIVCDYIEGSISYSKLLRGEAKPTEFRVLLDAYNKIRTLAKTNANTNLLHSDPILSNFLYIPQNYLAMPIDPHLALNPKKCLEEVDAALNLKFLYDIFRLQIENHVMQSYFDGFVERLEPCEAKRMKEFNQEKFVSGIAKAYLWVREPFAAFITNRPRINLGDILANMFPNHDKNKVMLLNKILESRYCA